MSDEAIRYPRIRPPIELFGKPYGARKWVTALVDRCPIFRLNRANMQIGMAIKSAYRAADVNGEHHAKLLGEEWVLLKAAANDPGPLGYPPAAVRRLDGAEVPFSDEVSLAFQDDVIEAGTTPPAKPELVTEADVEPTPEASPVPAAVAAA